MISLFLCNSFTILFEFNRGEFERILKGIQVGRPTSGRSACILHQIGQGNFPGTEYTKPTRLQKGHEDWPQMQAGRPSLGRPAPPVGLSLWDSSRGAGSIPLLPYPSCFHSKFMLIKFK